MSYVRTKDGHLFKTGKDLGRYGCSTAVLICDFHGNLIDLRQQNNILKEADTIEELFDAYVSVDDNGPHYMSKTVYKAFKYKISKNVYGAIWVFDGDGAPTLKPVAKMSDQGGWELL